MTIKLYDGQFSPNARKVRLLAAELDIPLARIILDFKGGDFRSPGYLAHNPNGKIPTLEDDGFVLWESAAILKYLATKRPERGLAPADPREQARIDQWLFWWTAHPEPALYQLAVERLIKPALGGAGNDPVLMGEARASLERFLPVLDQQLAGKEFILGKLSVVDFAAGSWLDVAPATLQVELERYPNVVAWVERLRARPYWKTT